MKKEELFEIIGEVDEHKVCEAGQVMSVKKKTNTVWFKWATIAACLCLILVASIPFIANIYQPKDPVEPHDIVEFNGAYYEILDKDNAKILKEYNLPKEITSNMVGDFVGASLDDKGNETKRFMHEYVPYLDAEQKAVYVLKEGEKYSFALFCNYIYKDDSEYTEASDMFALYGVDNAEDIASITMDGKTIKDAGKIKEFFDSLYNAYGMGNDEYQENIFQRMDEDKQQALAIELADSEIEIKIVTKAGVVINHISHFPTINYVSWALNYYNLDASALNSSFEVTENSVGEIGRGTFKLSVEISEEDANALSQIVNSGTWKEEPTDCESDCIINLKGHWMHYCSDSGILNMYNLGEMSIYSSVVQDVSGKSFVLSEEDRITVNAILEKYITLSDNDIGHNDEESMVVMGDYPAAVMVDDVVYYLAYAMSAEIDESAIVGYTTSYTDEMPQSNGETNFSRELNLPYAKVEGGIAILHKNEWWFCEAKTN